MQRKNVLGLGIGAFALAASSAFAAPIAIVNGDFNTLQVSSIDATPVTVTAGAYTDDRVGFHAPTSTWAYYGGGAGPATAFAPGWTNTAGKTGVEILVGEGFGANGQTGLVADLGEGGPADGGVLTQILSTTVAANTTYTLDLLVGKRAGFANGWNAAGYSVELLAGTTAFITGGTNANPASGSFAPMSLTFTTGATIDAQPLTIKLSLIASSAQVEFDNVTLDATVPEPASMGLLALAGISLLARRRR